MEASLISELVLSSKRIPSARHARHPCVTSQVHTQTAARYNLAHTSQSTKTMRNIERVLFSSFHCPWETWRMRWRIAMLERSIGASREMFPCSLEMTRNEDPERKEYRFVDIRAISRFKNIIKRHQAPLIPRKVRGLSGAPKGCDTEARVKGRSTINRSETSTRNHVGVDRARRASWLFFPP